MYLLQTTDEESWEQILDDADREHERGNTNFFAVALVSEAYEEWVHERIITMLFLPDIPKPVWLKFEHVINHDTSDEVLRFASQTLSGLQMIWNNVLNREHVHQFKTVLLNRTEHQNLQVA